MKPTAPLHASPSRPMKPTAPLRAHNTQKTSIFPTQRCRRFQASTGTREQRRQGFQPDVSRHEQRCHRFQATAHLASGIQLHHQQAPMRPPPPENSHAIRLGEVSIKYENVAIPTPIIQISKYFRGIACETGCRLRNVGSDHWMRVLRDGEGQAAAPVGGGGTGRETHSDKPRRCGGCRRYRRARAGFEARRRTK